MSLHVYNTITKKIEKFNPIEQKKVSIYTCGPTVYDFAHIGNFRTFLFEDLLKRWLMHLGYDVKHIMNITDIDDKTIKKANKEMVPLKEITEKYTEVFFNDLKWLKLVPANLFPRATNYIDEIICLIEKLIKKKIAYVDTSGSVYFDIGTQINYGKLTNLKLNLIKSRKKVSKDEYGKNMAQDFALWKAYKESEGEIFWDSPWGKGRPGWHIECSAMAMAELGENFDIHCGGVDNIFPHHENEIAQSESVTGKKFVNYWMHSEFLSIDGDKMSKTIGNVYNINDLKKMGFSPESIRYQLLSTHYRKKVIFSKNKKNEIDRVISRFLNFYNLLISKKANLLSGMGLPKEYIEFCNKMNNDLNVSEALAVFFTWMKSIKKRIKEKKISRKALGEAWMFLSVFNEVFDFIDTKKKEIPDNIRIILKKRMEARLQKDFALSDSLRNELEILGWKVDDSKEGQEVSENK